MEHHYRIGDHVSTPRASLQTSINLYSSYAYAPLLILFEKEPPMPDEQDSAEAGHVGEAVDTALLIPCVRVEMRPHHLDQESIDFTRMFC
jgi:hypothetical protein